MMQQPSAHDVLLVNDLTAALKNRKLKTTSAMGKKVTRPSVAALAPERPSMDGMGISSVAALAGQFSRVSEIEPDLENKPRQTSLEELQNKPGKKSVKSLAMGITAVMGAAPFGVASSAAEVRDRLRGREVTKADTPIAATLSRPVLAPKNKAKRGRRPPSRKGAFKSDEAAVVVEAVSNLPETPQTDEKTVPEHDIEKIVARTSPSIEYTTQMVPSFSVTYYNSPGCPMQTAAIDDEREDAL
uniref:Uncharacterized protein n=1 Tax=Florenciella parvula TaxID=236787 RepID=A0A7S2B006_9STRA|mmetsp:Transcript_11398/g.23849  ORF Transcript_11398/g.23849 Transcript_11398/m.23849 type:complete len:243 (+) Transcript_11398:224-952(+)